MPDAYQQHIDDFEVWEYPEFSGSIVNEFVITSEPIDEIIIQDEIDHQDMTSPDEEDVTAVAIIDNPPESIDDKINYIEAMGAQMADMLSEMDASLLRDMTRLIKQSVKKIILKELSLDEHVIKQMIAQSMEKINKNKSPCIVHVSEQDAAVFENKPWLEHVQISIDATLSPGSFIIKTKFSELQAILEDRLTVLFGL